MAERMDPRDLDRLADLVAERLAARQPGTLGPRLLTASEVATGYAVSASWVRENASRLGVIRLGRGPRARMRFDAEVVARALGPTNEPWPCRKRRTARIEAKSPVQVELLPVIGFDTEVPEKVAPRRTNARGPTPVDEHQRGTEATRPRRSRTTAHAPAEEETG